MTREEYRKKLSRIIGDESKVIELMIDLDNVIKHDLPPAEGATAEEFMEAHDLPIAYGSQLRVTIIKMLEKFATLHAQKIADKMVNKRLREELIKFDAWGYGSFTENQAIINDVDEYLKSREK